jgi:hypothetical protein
MTEGHDIYKHTELSLKAKGLYLHLARAEKEHYFTIESLVALSRDNRTSVYAGLRELENSSLLHKKTLRKDGRIHQVLYLLHTGKLNTEKLFKGILNNSTSITTNNKVIKEYNKKVSMSSLETKRLLRYWQNNITKHKTNKKTYQKGVERLERKYNHINRGKLLIKRRTRERSYGYKKISTAMRLYKKLLSDDGTLFTNELPYKVSLPVFFNFSSFIKKNYVKRTEGAGSWYMECCRGEEYCFKKYAKHTAIERLLLKKCRTKDEELLGRVAGRYIEFYSSIKNKLTLPNDTDAEYPTRFLKYLWKFVDKKFMGRKFSLYILLNKKFLDIEFIEYLQSMDWMK